MTTMPTNMKHTSPIKSFSLSKASILLIASFLSTQPLGIISSAYADNTTIIKPQTNSSTADDKTITDNDDPTDQSKKAEAFKNSLAFERMPGETELSVANQKLLTQNAKLEREINDLEMQVEVLNYERSGNLYMHGVATGLGSFIAGGFLSWLIFGRRNRW